MKIQAPRGTEDVLPVDAHKWHWIEQTFTNLVRRYGYEDIRTPTFEDTSLFTRSAGETSDVVTKEMYVFLDKGGRSIALKPEGTAGAMRAVIEHGICPTGSTVRLSYITPIFRYERPQKGRMREAHQVGLELLGSSSPAADCEVIEITVRFYQALGLDDAAVELNSIGRSECRGRFREVLLARVESVLKDQSEEFKAKVEKNPLRLLDSKDPNIQSSLVGMPPISDYLEEEGKRNFETLQSLLEEAQVPYRIAPGIVRGLDYYTDTVFEVISSKLGAQSSLCGGGRYDNLVKELGGPDTPAVGVAMGIERALIVLEQSESNMPGKPRPDAFVISATSEAAGKAALLARSLRSRGYSVVQDPDAKSLRSQLRQADRYGCRCAAILGEDEMGKGTVQIRSLDDGSQVEVAFDRAAEALGPPALH